ncbi:MAG: hypothetical protein ACLP01_13330 [Solirubrobacteraceae bacterium]
MDKVQLHGSHALRQLDIARRFLARSGRRGLFAFLVRDTTGELAGVTYLAS